jgi:hypothetical protein
MLRPTSFAPHFGHVHNGGGLCFETTGLFTGWRQSKVILRILHEIDWAGHDDCRVSDVGCLPDDGAIQAANIDASADAPTRRARGRGGEE